MSKKEKRSIAVFYSHIITCLTLTLANVWVTTQYVAHSLGYWSQLGRPIWFLDGYPIYAPWQWFVWAYHHESIAPKVFEQASWITYGFFFLMVGVMMLLAIARNRRKGDRGTYGSARWAETQEMKKAALCEDAGVVLAQSSDAEFSCYIKEKEQDFELAWKMEKLGKHLIRHSGPEHIFCFAPTRSGKGVGMVIPTLLTWTHSALIYDIKKELWQSTAGWRQQFSRCLRFEPSEPGSVRFNPLMEIRKGNYEVRDVQNVADILVDPEGDKNRQMDHWSKTGHSLLVGAILHVLYAEEDKSLFGVSSFLSDPQRTIHETLHRMLTFQHLQDGPHPVVASCAREMLNKSENELSGVLSTAMSFLGLYRDPIIAENTRVSDFAINNLMNADCPVSLYLVVPPSDIDRTKPLMRLMLNQIGRRLTEKMEFGEKRHYDYRLLMMLDEFPSLGKLGFFETELAYLAGYGIKCFMIAQSLNQIEYVYGQNNSILDNSHIRITYGALDDRTRKRISDLLGESTERRMQFNFSGNRLAPWLGHVMESEQESPRPLLTPGEVGQLSADSAIVMVGGMPPYLGKKVMYYQDPRFKERAWLPTPDNDIQMHVQLNGLNVSDDWRDHRPPEQSEATEEMPAPLESGNTDMQEEWSDLFESQPEVSHANINSDHDLAPYEEAEIPYEQYHNDEIEQHWLDEQSSKEKTIQREGGDLPL